MKALPGEKMLWETSDKRGGGVWLTTNRLVREQADYRLSFSLDKLDSIVMTYRRSLALFIIGLLCVAGAMVSPSWTGAINIWLIAGLVVVGILFIAGYFLSRRRTVEVYSHRSKLVIDFRSLHAAQTFIREVEKAKKRLLEEVGQPATEEALG